MSVSLCSTWTRGCQSSSEQCYYSDDPSTDFLVKNTSKLSFILYCDYAFKKEYVCKECCFASYVFGDKTWALKAANFTNNLSKGHMIHMVMLMSKHLHNKKQDWIVRNGKQFLMELQIQNSFLNAVHKAIQNIKLRIYKCSHFFMSLKIKSCQWQCGDCSFWEFVVVHYKHASKCIGD